MTGSDLSYVPCSTIASRSKPLFSTILLALGLIASFASTAQTLPWTANEIEVLASDYYFSTPPVDLAESFPEPVANATLTQILRDRNKEPVWTNAATMLGLSAGAPAAGILIAFIERGSGSDASVSLEGARAISAAILSLGYLVIRTGSGQALDYLIAGVNPPEWNMRSLSWTSEAYPSNEERNKQLAIVCILALALTAQPRALATLQSLDKRIEQEPRNGQPALPPQMHAAVTHALESFPIIQEYGLLGYYRLQHKPILQSLRPGSVSQ